MNENPNLPPQDRTGARGGGKSTILVGICSSRDHVERRRAIRETWMAGDAPGVLCRFFVGGGDPVPNEPDVIALDAADDYDHLPLKTLAFFRHALEGHDFEWLFKCDDDTYVALDRLLGLVPRDHDFIGNEFLEHRGSPSGGAGYLLSRRFVTELAQDPDIPATGAEDVLIGEAAIRHGARPRATPRLCWSNERFPAGDNDVVTSHWCSPGRLRVIHASLHEPGEVVEASHAAWHDTISLFQGGLFTRHGSRCGGRWQRLGDAHYVLDWFDWDREILISDNPPGPAPAVPRYRCVPAPSEPPDIVAPGDAAAAEGEATAEETVVVFLTTTEYGLPHLDWFLAHNPGVRVHVESGKIAPAGEMRTRAWMNCDRLIRGWWMRQGRDLDFRHAVFLEWDVLFDSTLKEVFPRDVDYYCGDLKKPGMDWSWFSQIDLLPESLRPHATGTPPLAVIRLSRRCLEAVFSHPDSEECFNREIQAELRLATLAAACGFEPVKCPGTLRNVTCANVPVGFGPSVWHAVKTRQHELPRMPAELSELAADRAGPRPGSGAGG